MTKIRQIRKQLGSTAEVADILQMSQSRLRDIEGGRRPARSDEQQRIAECFGTTVDQLFDPTRLALSETNEQPAGTAEVSPPPGRDMHQQRTGYGTDARRAADAAQHTQMRH